MLAIIQCKISCLNTNRFKIINVFAIVCGYQIWSFKFLEENTFIVSENRWLDVKEGK